MSNCETSDVEIRQVLNQRILGNYRNRSQLVIEELGLDHGRNRIDIAVLSSSIHGFEIKSSRDTLRRLPNQLTAYTAALEKLTLVVAPNHLESVQLLLPDWCGLMVVEKGIRGGLKIRSIRKPSRNPKIDIFRMAHLLWKNEAMILLNKYGIQRIPNRATRTQLYRTISEYVSVSVLRDFIKQCFVARESWRVGVIQKKGDD